MNSPLKDCPLLDERGRLALAEALGESPVTTIASHQLRRGLCRAWVAGEPSRFDAAIVQGDACPAEPTGFGDDPNVLWGLLKHVEGWTCIDVSRDLAPDLGRIIERERDVRVRLYDDVYHVLERSAPALRNDAVRRMMPGDLPLLEAAPTEVAGCGFGDLQTLLTDGVVACAIIDGRVVSIAHTSARTKRYADVGVCTLAPWRGRGFAMAAASIVAEAVQQAGQLPVWSVGADNAASLRVARKLGFVEVARTTYVIPETRA